ncbi:MAG: PEP/pyruvate-binding domain-containing protein [Thermodesulfobacteriota bacterium]
MFQLIKKFFSSPHKGHPSDPESEERDRNLFQARYHAFKLLLAANNNALEIMTEMEKALSAEKPFGMAFVRSRCTSVSTNVYQIIDNLSKLSPGKYQELHSVFRDIRNKIQTEMTPHKLDTTGPLLLEFEDINKESSDIVGPKMAHLGEIKNNLRLPVPDGFVLTSFAYCKFIQENDLQTEIDRRIQTTKITRTDKLFDLCSGLQTLITQSPVPREITAALHEGYEHLVQKTGMNKLHITLRSSALGEDLPRTSFAGQYRSVLNVDKENLEQVYKLILASKYSPQAVSYRYHMGLKDEEIAMCVGCMPMVPAQKSGVIYSRNPLNFKDQTIKITSTWGLAKSIVDGTTDPDQYTVSCSKPEKILEKNAGKKSIGYYCSGTEGLSRTEISSELQDKISLSEKDILALARIARKLEKHYGHPQDIEWSMDDKNLWLLQTRPLAEENTLSETEAEGRPALPSIPPLSSEGVTAAPGASRGKVFKVEKDADLIRFIQGCILVARHSSPKWAAVLPRSGGVLTEHGSITGHLANVAREFGIPAVFGVRDIFSVLENGQTITMDADRHYIYAGDVPEILEKKIKKRNQFENSPIHNTLKKISSYITPLNLLDPESLDFKPENCRTLHDITRFAHEKSVQEMFNFGKNQNFSPRTGKQLKTSTDMQWWVLDIEDGFKKTVSGKTVSLDNIQSIPMLAIWNGMMAIPWQGPPSMDKGGFMSVLIQAVGDPNLEPSMSSKYSLKNYFMISRNFCHLQSRFGFHLTEVEALVGKRTQENYARFQFKGGGADLSRRKIRTQFIGDILQEFAFQCNIKEDALFARVDDFEEDFMVERLKILGYLLMHTRQLDMIMSKTESRNYYRQKIKKDIKEGMGIKN